MSITFLNWIVPTTILLCGFAFLAIRQLDFPTARWGYALCSLAIGYALMLFETEHFTPFKQIVEDGFILFGVILAARALRHRLDLKSSLLLDATVMILCGVMVAASVVLFKSVRLETLFVEACCAFVLWTASLPFSWQARNRPDRVLAMTFLILSALLTSQCLVFIIAPHVDPAVGAWRSSIWGNLVQYTGLVGSVALAFCVMIAAADDVAEKHRVDANTDPMTNLLNRRGLDALLSSHRGKEMVTGPTAVIVADIDHFKSVNDRFGHIFGDGVIKRFSAIFKAQSGASDCVARIGGEEFLMLLPGVSLDEAIAIADRVRWKFACEHAASDGAGECFTASFGVATLLSGDEAIMDAIGRADTHLYSAKRSGRNCVISQRGDFFSGSKETALIPSHNRSLYVSNDAYITDSRPLQSTQTH